MENLLQLNLETPIQLILPIILTVWLLTGLALEAILAQRQIRHLNHELGNDAAARYSIGRVLITWFTRVGRLLRLAVWLMAGLLPSLAAAIEPLGWWAGPTLFVLFAILDGLFKQLLIWLRWLALDRRFDVSNAQWTTVCGDGLRQIALDACLAFGAGILLLWPFTLYSSKWLWIGVASLLIAGLLGLGWIWPNLIAPLFNRFRELPEGEIRQRLLAMTIRCGARLASVQVMDSSRRSKLANAYFAGVGRNRRVVLSDTLIERLSPSQIEAVMAHELGHDQCRHIWHYYSLQGTLIWLAIATSGTFAASWLPTLSPAVVCCALYLLLPALAWPLTPWLACLRRRYEYEADAFAARYTSSQALYEALEILLGSNPGTHTMDSCYAFFYATHPLPQSRLQKLAANNSEGKLDSNDHLASDSSRFEKPRR